MRPISVLFTNNSLGPRGGSETYVRDVALALLRKGHRPMAFSLVLGDVAAELRRATIPVIDDVTRLGEAPDVIHGHHHLETLIATLAFPDTPVVNFCHGWLPWEELPLHHPSVRRYVAVDEVCVDRLVREEGIAPSMVELLLNFVDLDRFQPRPVLPPRPARALVLSNAARATGYAAAIREACESAGIAVDIVGAAAGNTSSAPEQLLAQYDLVFAKGRTALEALAVGCATVLADFAGAGPLVTPDNYEILRVRNFGIRELTERHDADWYRAQIANYRAPSAAVVSARVRAEAGLDPAVARLVAIYTAAITAPPGAGPASRAAAVHCSRIALPLKQAYGLSSRIVDLSGELVQAREMIDVQAATAAHHAAVAEALAERVDAQAATAAHHAAVAEALAERVDAQAATAAHHAAVAEALAGRVDALVVESSGRLEAACEAERQHALAARALESRIEALLTEARGWRQASVDAEHRLAEAQARVHGLETQVAAFQSLPTLRLRDAVLRAPVVGPVLRRFARRLSERLSEDLDRADRSAGPTFRL